MADRDKRDDNVAVPFFPRKWLNWVTGIYLLILLLGIFVKKPLFGLLGWEHLSDTWVSDISILTTVMFFFTFVVGRVYYWMPHKNRAIGENEFADKVEEVLKGVKDDSTLLTPQDKLDRIYGDLAEYIEKVRR